MAGIRPVDDLTSELAAVVIEAHVEILRAHARGLPRRTLGAAAKNAADIAKSRCPERRPAEQPRAEDAERNRHRQFAFQAGKGGHRQRDNAAADLDDADRKSTRLNSSHT